MFVNGGRRVLRNRNRVKSSMLEWTLVGYRMARGRYGRPFEVMSTTSARPAATADSCWREPGICANPVTSGEPTRWGAEGPRREARVPPPGTDRCGPERGT